MNPDGTAGQRGNSLWISNRQTVIDIVGENPNFPGDSNPIVFHRGVVDFEPWRVGEPLSVSGLVGTRVNSNADLGKIYDEIGRLQGLSTREDALTWLREHNPPLSPHHAGGDRVILVPRHLHTNSYGGVQHTDVSRFPEQELFIEEELMVLVVDRLTELGIKPLKGTTFVPFKEQQLEEIESQMSVTIPEGYRNVLSRFGGSMLGTVVNSTVSSGQFFFGYFFDYPELREVRTHLDDFLPQGVIPIGTDGGDITFCLNAGATNHGIVYICDNNIGWPPEADAYLEEGTEVPNDIRYEMVEQISESFEEFIGNMQMQDNNI